MAVIVRGRQESRQPFTREDALEAPDVVRFQVLQDIEIDKKLRKKR